MVNSGLILCQYDIDVIDEIKWCLPIFTSSVESGIICADWSLTAPPPDCILWLVSLCMIVIEDSTSFTKNNLKPKYMPRVADLVDGLDYCRSLGSIFFLVRHAQGFRKCCLLHKDVRVL